MPEAQETAPQTAATDTGPASAAASPAAAVVELSEEDAAAKERKRWKKTLIVVGNHRIDAGEKRTVIVAESRTFDEGGTPTLKTDDYPAKADLYYRTDPAVNFPKDAKTLTLGQNVRQGMFWGFSADPRFIHVGPASPAYGAANLAWQRGADEIEIVGLSDAEKDQLKPWFTKLAEGGPLPVEGAPDVRAPADVKITLT